MEEPWLEKIPHILKEVRSEFYCRLPITNNTFLLALKMTKVLSGGEMDDLQKQTDIFKKRDFIFDVLPEKKQLLHIWHSERIIYDMAAPDFSSSWKMQKLHSDLVS